MLSFVVTEARAKVLTGERAFDLDLGTLLSLRWAIYILSLLVHYQDLFYTYRDSGLAWDTCIRCNSNLNLAPKLRAGRKIAQSFLLFIQALHQHQVACPARWAVVVALNVQEYIILL